jgi:hypothetical protein
MEGITMRPKNVLAALLTLFAILAGMLISAPAQAAEERVKAGTYATLEDCEAAGRAAVQSNHFMRYECVADSTTTTHSLYGWLQG